jgi:hypothetical protein
MSRERWGAFSVRDHTFKRPFAADVLMYDRLVIPYPANPEERARWPENTWAPKRLDWMLRSFQAARGYGADRWMRKPPSD